MHLFFLLAQSQPDPEMVQKIMLTMIPMIMVFGLICVAIIIIPFWFICKKAGFSPWLALLNIIPLGNLVLIYVLAFAEWKVAPAPPATWATGFPPTPPTV
ncbi:MAG: hypothetical protein WAL75_12235 [Terracidiphilus sp.]